ncbi:polysaccharide pyruvyl transferase family protein [Bizionia sp. KMM 8389]
MANKKIKTITCHEVYNHGASLQEYALLKYLNSLGFEAETIHYKPPYLSQHFKLWSVSPRFDKPILKQLYLLAKLPKRLRDLKRKKVFDVFADRYIPTGNTRYENNEELKKNLPEADVFICGSDQIWNSFFQNGKDPAFYLNFVPDNKVKMSYAASFAIDELDKDVKPLVQSNVSRLDAIGVRESSGVGILNDLGIDRAVQVLDPVFLLSKAYWLDTFVSPIDRKFIFVYDFDSNPLVKKIALFLKATEGWDIYTVNNNIDYADKNFWLHGPEQFLSLVSQSQFNITNSFHSVAFSIIFEQQFVVVNRTEKINTRMRDVLGLFDLDDKLISDFEAFNYKRTINYKVKTALVSRAIEHSKQFLKNSLKA